VNAAVYLLEPEFFKFLPQGVKGDIARDIFPAAIQKEPFYAYNSPEYLKDMGTPDRLAKVTQDFTSGKVKALRIENPRPTVFLDRDGVVIEYVPEIHKIEDVKLREGVAEAIHKLNQKGFLVIVATNQPMIAKGFLTEEELHQIHAKIETLISEEGAWIDRFYYCPHHPEKGFAGEVKELKIRCDCRKPGTGMLEQASQDYCINKESSFMIGDTWRDVECGKRFSLNAIGLMGGAGFPYSEEVIQKQTSEAADKLSSYQPQNLFKNLSEAAEFILQKFNKNSQQK
jgi:histidinol-phosphate phosphatase family protein